MAPAAPGLLLPVPRSNLRCRYGRVAARVQLCSPPHRRATRAQIEGRELTCAWLVNLEVPRETPRAEFVKDVETDVRHHGESKARESITRTVFAARLPKP